MNIESILGPLVTPGELDCAKQDWRRDPATWRARFLSVLPAERLGNADPNEIADGLERYFAGLP